MAPASYKLPLMGNMFARMQSTAEAFQADLMNYETIQYDYNTMTYKTESQSREINELKGKLEEKESKRAQDLKSIIGYFYKR